VKSRFKKGDEVYRVSFWSEEADGKCIFWAEKVVLQSWGKRQGTAVNHKDGELCRHRFYNHPVEHFLRVRGERQVALRIVAPAVFRSAFMVEAFAAAVGPMESASAIARNIWIESDWLANHQHRAKPAIDIVENARRKLAVLQAAVPAYEIRWR